MKIKRFIANNMRQALLCVRKEQGPDAVILSNRRVDGGIEVVAAVDYDETLINPMLTDEAPGNKEHSSRPADDPFEEFALFDDDADEVATTSEPPLETNSTTANSVADSSAWSRESALGAIREEIKGMRSLLSDQLSSMAWNDEIKRDPETVSLLRRYAAMGLDADIARQVAAMAGEGSGAERSTLALAQALPVLDDNILDEGGVVAVIGPTGVGKTTSIAKLAARFALRHGRDQVALISTDTFRIGAQEQLATFAQILDVPVHRVTDKDELSPLLASLADKKLVLIDTAGVSQRVKGLADHLSAFSARGTRIQTYLALAANGHSQTLDEVVSRFGCVPLDGCILTKVDESACLGAAFSAVIRHELPIAFLANGQRVPEDLHAAVGKNKSLVKHAMRLMRESGQQVGEEFMARNFAEVGTHAYA